MIIGNNWDTLLKDEYKQEYFKELIRFLDREYALKTIYPVKINIFKALQLTPYDQVKVVIIGQDPYHNEGEAYGLAFSVKPPVKMPPSLRNIFKELEADLKIKRSDTNLEDWAT